MSAECSHCGTAVEESYLPRIEGARMLCPRCHEPMDMPSLTIPFREPEDVATIFAAEDSGGALSPDLRYALVVMSGKEPGKVFPIQKPRVTLGRFGCDVVLDDGELSRRHALIAINGTSAHIQDLGSTNGISVGGNRVRHAVLADGSEFRLGSHELLFVMTPRETPAEAGS